MGPNVAAVPKDEPKPITYQVPEAVHAELVDAFAERFTLDVKAGAHAPKNEREEFALEHLVSLGLATKGEEE